jgi:hypothetical protein
MPPNIVGSLMAQFQNSSNNLAEGLGKIGQSLRSKRFDDLGKEFLSRGDISREGFRKFVIEKGLGANEAIALAQTLGAIREQEKKMRPATESFETMGPGGNTYTQIRDMESPNANPVATFLKSLVDKKRMDAIDSTGGTVSYERNPKTGTVTPTTTQTGKPVRTGLSPDEKTMNEVNRQKALMPGRVKEHSLKQKAKTYKPITPKDITENISRINKQISDLEARKDIAAETLQPEIEAAIGRLIQAKNFWQQLGAGVIDQATFNKKLAEIDTVEGAQTGGKKLTEEQAKKYLNAAGGDKEKAREMARRDGWVF